jgi:dCTP diphosphatase
MNDLQKILEKHKKFTQERTWDRFQNPKNLCMALSVEVAELSEIFMWLTEKQANSLNKERRQSASDELGDILLYLLRIADGLGIDLIEAANEKMKKNIQKYPIDKAIALAENFVNDSN